MSMRNTWVAALAVAALALGGQVTLSEEVTIAAKDLSASSKNVVPVYNQFGGLTLAAGQGGFAEWTFELKSPYADAFRGHLHILYASGERRGCRLTINGEVHVEDVLTALTSAVAI